MTDEEFFRMTEKERYEYIRKYQERCVRLLQFGFNVHEVKAWDWDHDEGFWNLWETLGLETSYQIALELERMKHERERDDWYGSQWIN